MAFRGSELSLHATNPGGNGRPLSSAIELASEVIAASLLPLDDRAVEHAINQTPNATAAQNAATRDIERRWALMAPPRDSLS